MKPRRQGTCRSFPLKLGLCVQTSARNRDIFRWRAPAPSCLTALRAVNQCGPAPPAKETREQNHLRLKKKKKKKFKRQTKNSRLSNFSGMFVVVCLGLLLTAALGLLRIMSRCVCVYARVVCVCGV